MWKWLKRLLKLSIFGALALGLLLFGSYEWITYQSQEQLSSDISQIKPHKVAMVLGTARWVRNGRTNLFFKYRMEAVKQLFDNHKIEYVIVSGDNSIKEYNETRDMKKYLIELGIPNDKIIEDYAGFSTLDSVVRTKEVFGQDNIIIVTQPFHNQRAVFIANNYGIKAVGFNAKSVNKKYAPKTYIREYLARVKCMLDVYILHRMPKFYKEKEDFPS